MNLGFNDLSRVSTVKNVTWTISNLCRGKPAPDFGVVRASLPVLSRLVNHADLEVVGDACWALSYLSNGPNERITAVIGAGVVPRLVELLGSTNASVLTPALRCVGKLTRVDIYDCWAP